MKKHSVGRLGGRTVFTRELDFFMKNQKRLVSKYRGRYLVIIGESVIGDYRDPASAYLAAKENHEPGTFMIQACCPGPSAYTVTIASAGLVKLQA